MLGTDIGLLVTGVRHPTSWQAGESPRDCLRASQLLGELDLGGPCYGCKCLEFKSKDVQGTLGSGPGYDCKGHPEPPR